ncbi:TRAP transporter small permease subunit [Denitrobaculum tricleocarpae]|uniref:TRAP transporter small permease protein n=1 Tax=Denitrobaculum tricleocarpae TaxID=2591009 RepID=A0A545TKD4_9PROT|nr:TRAP transporter small permease subunit [Denitrobaculum tricleocarpae]TQV77668.1 TRAP transporter small permease subunit [Denitrobaculum tricleocarpae]
MTEKENPGGARHHDDPGSIAEAGFLGRIIDKTGIVFAIGIVLSMAILINEVILRYLFNAPTIWAHETTIFICGMAFIYGGLYCAARDQHIRVVLIYDFVPPRVRRILNIAISIISAAACGMFAWASWIMVQRAAFMPDGTFRLERSGSAWDPVYPGLVKVSLFIIMSIMCVQFLILAYNYARKKPGEAQS